MDLLKLVNIGKIYVSDSNISVGIRNVNLSFNIGEFVAITGKSGSGKSTLLNVISGMDTYEEGEMFVNGEETSYYQQQDWEDYRLRYISFIFQDYNIIDSFTVLQNVELALMNIRDKKERKARAMELIKRVGLEEHANHKGSKLSGGQKQRTVIARALAKDSPIILADEPTGNLDATSGKEIIDLLHEVSKDKLVIIVTHNFEQVEQYATRHIRIFDGNVASDDVITETPKQDYIAKDEIEFSQKDIIKDSFSLGHTIFKSKPKLTFFICLLLIVAVIGIFADFLGRGMVNTLSLSSNFTHIDGRVIITNKDGSAITDQDLETISKDTNANDYIRYDQLIDSYANFTYGDNNAMAAHAYYGYNKKPSTGKLPENDDEVLLYVSIAEKPYLSGVDTITISDQIYNLSGIKYFYNNQDDAMLYFTKSGYEKMMSRAFFQALNKTVVINNDYTYYDYSIILNIDDKINDGKIHVDIPLNEEPLNSFALLLSNNPYDIPLTDYTFKFVGDTEYVLKLSLTSTKLLEIFNNYTRDYYSQASLFYDNDMQAKKAIQILKDKGYIAILSSNSGATNDNLDAIVFGILKILTTISIIVDCIFYALFIYICLIKSMNAFGKNVAIMRSMGIPTKVIKRGLYFRMMISLIPAFILVASLIIALTIIPATNPYIKTLKWYSYILLVLAIMIFTVLTTKWQIKRTFRMSVKKAIKEK